MGNLQSAVSKEVAAAYTNVVNSVVNSVINQNDLSCTSGAEFSFSTGIIPGVPPNPSQPCPFGFTDGTITVTTNQTENCTLNSQNITNISTTIKNRIQTTTKQWITHNLNNYQGWLAFAFNTQVGKSTTVDKVSTDIANSVSNNIQNQCSAELSALSIDKIALCGYYSNDSLNFNQTVTLTSLTSCLNKNIINTIDSNSVISQMVQETDQNFSSEQEGVFSWLRILLIIGGILLGIVIIGVIIFLVADG